jgi:alpha-ketoglutarate-dependent taurine dioxygenase
MPAPAIEQRPLGSFGTEVRGCDLGSERSPDEIRRLVDLVAGARVALFPGQNLTRAQFDRFGRYWGEPCRFFFTPDLDREFPAIQMITNSPELDPGRRDGAAFWHTDESFEHLPASFTMLHALEAPDVGGETLFADQAGAYDALPGEMKARIEGLRVRHMLVGGKRGPDEVALGFDVDDITKDGGVRAMKRATERPLHPLVATHPITGRKTLYSISGTGIGIEGMADDEAEALLDDLKAHATHERFRIRPKLQTGDVLIWDDLTTLHSATPLKYSDADGERRRLQRICVCGLPPVYADRRPAFSPPPEGSHSRAYVA